jgi:acetoin:2,6-dichlorophenolindophenol oxidoreductase subunit alpha
VPPKRSATGTGTGNGTATGTTAGPLDRATAIDLLTAMWRIRRFEERMATLHQRLLVHGLIHLSIGSEGVAAGVCRQLRGDDEIYSGHRAHGHVLAKGASMDRVMAELMGRSAGLCQGLGGSMHLVDIEHGVMGATGVVGGNLPMAAGGALAARITGSDRVTVVFFGDGAVQAGHFAETVNLASLWELPLILVCENNGMAEFTTRAEHTRVDSVCDVVAPYGFDCQVVEGADVEAIWSAFGGYLEKARGGTGPFLLEYRTHRRRGHYEGDPLASRNALDDAEWAKLDPIAQLESAAKQRGWLDEEGAQTLTSAADAEIDRAIEFGRTSEPIAPAQAAELVYAA